jgi:hypothetical protein
MEVLLYHFTSAQLPFIWILEMYKDMDLEFRLNELQLRAWKLCNGRAPAGNVA